MDSKKLLKRLSALIVFIFCINFLANTFYWYSSIWYFDIIMHFLGGVWVGLLSLYLFRPAQITSITALEVLLCVFIAGIGWEIFEVAVDTAISGNSFNFFDTASDVCFDLAGGIAALFYYRNRIVVSSGGNI